MATGKIYQFRADLKGVKPAIWRRFEVDGDETTLQLGKQQLQLFDFFGDQMYSLTQLSGDQFKRTYRKKRKEAKAQGQQLGTEISPLDTRMKNVSYVMEFEKSEQLQEWLPNIVKPGETKLNETGAMEGTKFLFEYDFRAGFEVSLKLEKITPKDGSEPELPHVLKGKGPGISGALDPDDLQEMMGSGLIGPEDFDLEDADEMIKDIDQL